MKMMTIIEWVRAVVVVVAAAAVVVNTMSRL